MTDGSDQKKGAKLLKPRLLGKEIVDIIEQMHELIVTPAKEGDVMEPLYLVTAFLEEYSWRVIAPINGINMTMDNMIEIYNVLHEDLINRMRNFRPIEK
jgi:hypothetical protein